jgi:flagellar biosynthesis protein FlhF
MNPNLQVFKAATMAEALTQVKHVMGVDAVILHTRTFQIRYCLGLRRREVVEITAGKGFNVTPRGGPRRPASNGGSGGSKVVQSRPSPRPGGGGLAAYASHSATALAARPTPSNTDIAPRNAVEGSRALLETPAANSAAFLSLTTEMSALKSMVKDLVTHTRSQRAPQVPEDLFDYYMQLIENQVADELATDIIRTIQKQVRPEQYSQADVMREKIAEQLEKLLPTCGPIKRTKASGPHVVALVGPTGVGKTTTIAKLAANLKLREKHRVGLITLDTYRIAAVDQLKKYAEIIGSPLRVVLSPEDLTAALLSMRDCDYVLIDTAGRSPNDTMKLNELKSLLAIAEPDEVHLVLSTTNSEDAIQLAINRFSDVGTDKIIFTKLDEASHVGVVLNVVRKVNKSLSYVTTGQDVPDDIEVGRGRRLAQLILGSGV